MSGSLHFLQVNCEGFGFFFKSNQAGFPPTLLGKNLGCKSQFDFSSKNPMSIHLVLILIILLSTLTKIIETESLLN